jgi:hypothetical protein
MADSNRADPLPASKALAVVYFAQRTQFAVPVNYP